MTKTLGNLIKRNINKSPEDWYLNPTGTDPIKGTPVFNQDDIHPEGLVEAAAIANDLTSNNNEFYPGSDAVPQKDIFDELNSSAAESKFNTLSNSGQLDTKATGKFIIDKTGQEQNPKIPNIEQVYSDVNNNGPSSNLSSVVQEVLKEKTGQNSQNNFVPNTFTNGEREDLIVLGTDQTEPGTFLRPDQGTQLKLKDLKKIGILTLLRASGEQFADSIARSDDPNTPYGNAEAEVLSSLGTTVPGLARMGQKIPLSKFDKAAIQHLINPNIQEKDNTDNFLYSDDKLTYGNANNPFVPFVGLTSFGAITSAAALLLIVTGMIELLSGVVSLLYSPISLTPQGGNTTRLGSFYPKKIGPQFNNPIYLKLAQVRYDYFTCVNKGLELFFGSSTGTGFLSTVGQTAGRMLTEHGWFNNLLRNIVQNTSDILGLKLAGGGPNNSSLLSDTSSATGIIDKLNRSPLLTFMNVMANLGDIALDQEDRGFVVDGEIISDIDNISDVATSTFERGNNLSNPAVNIAKGKLSKEHGGGLAWGQNTVGSLYAMPSNIINGANLYYGGPPNSPINKISNALNNKNVLYTNKGGRIPAEMVQEMERYLEAEYMPFYFHDLRTNEIVSFHAFLESLTDGFEPEYNDSEAYGRVGKVHTWKNTDRSIGMKFAVVPTNQEDFDLMWWKINKMVTLVYPQYSEGRVLTYAGNRFVQPFSQIPTSSPMIRLRLGDLFRSNYSKFALARMFGMGVNQFILQGVDQNGNFQYQQRITDYSTNIRNRMQSGRWHTGEKAILRNGARAIREERSNTTTPTQPSGRQRNPLNTSARDYSALHTMLEGGRAQSNDLLQVGSNTPVEIQNTQHINDDHTCMVQTLESPGIRALVHYQDLMPDESEVLRQAVQAVQREFPQPEAGLQARGDSINAFFNSNNNPIVKSFESVQGKGLAGFIKSLRFDWLENTIWETEEYNSRAPKLCKIELDFMPVHDIPLGIDANGFTTAPAYPVGNISSRLVDEPIQNEDPTVSYRQARNAVVKSRKE